VCVCLKQYLSFCEEEKRSQHAYHWLLDDTMSRNDIVHVLQTIRLFREDKERILKWMQPHSASPPTLTVGSLMQKCLHVLKAHDTDYVYRISLMLQVGCRMDTQNKMVQALRILKRIWSSTLAAPARDQKEVLRVWQQKCLPKDWQERRQSFVDALAPIRHILLEIKQCCTPSSTRAVQLSAPGGGGGAAAAQDQIKLESAPAAEAPSWSVFAQDNPQAGNCPSDLGLPQLGSWNGLLQRDLLDSAQPSGVAAAGGTAAGGTAAGQLGDVLASAVAAAGHTPPAAVPPAAAVAPAAATQALFVFPSPAQPPAAVAPAAVAPAAVAPAAAAPRWIQLFDPRWWLCQPSTQPSAAERQSWASTAAAQEKERTSRGVPSRQKRVPGKRLDGNKDMRFKDNRSDLPYGENADGTPDMRLTTNRKKKK